MDGGSGVGAIFGRELRTCFRALPCLSVYFRAQFRKVNDVERKWDAASVVQRGAPISDAFPS